MKTVTTATLATVLMFAGIAGAADAPIEGRFVMAGPVNQEAQELSMRWQYGLMVNVSPEEILEVKFSCEPIPGTSFSVKGSDLKRLKNGALYAEGATLVISSATTPWFYEFSTTNAECRAIVLASNQREAVITAKVSFSGAVKSAALREFQAAQRLSRPSVLAKDWKVGHTARNNEQQVTEFVLPGQTVHSWTELLSRQIVIAAPGLSLSRFLEAMRQGFGADCKDMQWRVVKETDNEALYAWSHAGCEKFPPQAERALITKVSKGVCRWAYVTKSPPLSREVESQLDAELAALPCD
jgi:hypothetical protein